MKFQVEVVGLVFKIIENKLCLLIGESSARDGFNRTLPAVVLTTSLSPEEAIAKHIERLGVNTSYIEQLYTFTDSDTGAIAMAYIMLANENDQASEVQAELGSKWISSKRMTQLKGLSRRIGEAGLQRLRNKISYSRIATRLLNDEFTLSDLKEVYELILDEPIDKRNFSKKIETKKLAVPTNKYRYGTHRPARLYKRGPKAKNVPL